jgi:hypothetical protein
MTQRGYPDVFTQPRPTGDILSIRGKKIFGDAFVGNRDVRCDTDFLAIGVADTVCPALMGGSNL